VTTRFEDLKGQTIIAIDITDHDSRVEIKTKEGNEYLIMHHQDCCENVYLAEIVGDINDIIGSKILEAEEVTEECTKNAELGDYYYDEACMWTFYKLRTRKGIVTLRWLGTSNGYYSVGVSFSLYNEDRWH